MAQDRVGAVPVRSTIQWAVSLILAGVLCLGAAAVYEMKQPQITVGNGYGWDGKSYAAMYRAGAAGETALSIGEVPFPFCKRVGLPFVASITGAAGFAKINVASGIVAALAVFLVALRRTGVLGAISVMLPMIFYLFAPLRFTNFYPWTVDPPLMAMMALALVALEFGNAWLTIALLVAGAAIKETSFYFALVATLSLVTFEGALPFRQRILVTVICVGAAAGGAAVYKLLYPSCSGRAAGVIFHYGVQILSDPWRVLTVLAAVLLTFAPFLWGLRDPISPGRLRTDAFFRFSVAAFLVALAMAAVGGSDSTRLFYVCYPIFAGLAVYSVARTATVPMLVLASAGLLANRWLSVIPDPEAPAPDIASFQGYFVYFPDVANPVVATAIIVLFGALYLLLYATKDWKIGRPPGW